MSMSRGILLIRSFFLLLSHFFSNCLKALVSCSNVCLVVEIQMQLMNFSDCMPTGSVHISRVKLVCSPNIPASFFLAKEMFSFWL